MLGVIGWEWEGLMESSMKHEWPVLYSVIDAIESWLLGISFQYILLCAREGRDKMR